ncbi:predicted protein [Naegleria gruberi]|uniref:Predicted protein n=1 Tax=Naegleria gruberi TaxID=5762 RepID=D2V9P1_NAEGR|nr:uncharacterized protein NAEGRDRAFT_32117 [Naegleria gruberi]EFC46500.1 predicted protein [Naegleria gruberi]|eukprot:XP_002679244.1 predicted protein [Naegleria gruberi strain NEG-M]
MQEQLFSEKLSHIKNIIIVLSGKGGVGKSTVSCQLALTLANMKYKVGILDVDICGPSVPGILGVSNKEIVQSQDELKCMSIGFLLKNKDDAVIWRGPKKNSMIKQFIQDVCWKELDFLIIDTPPGTSDEHITLAELLRDFKNINSIIVTTPQNVSTIDVSREINFCKKLNIPIRGIIENMSGYVCPCCKEITFIFGSGGGQKLSNEYNIPFLGSIPIEPELANAEDNGINYIKNFSNSVTSMQFTNIVNIILN